MKCFMGVVFINVNVLLLLDLEEGQSVESDRQELESCFCPLPNFNLFHYLMKILKPISC